MRMHRCLLLALLALFLADAALAQSSPGRTVVPQPSRTVVSQPGRTVVPQPGRTVGPPPVASEEYLEAGPGPMSEYGPGPGPMSDYGPVSGCADGCCGDGGCDACCQQACDSHPFCIAAGYAFTFLKPHFENDTAYVRSFRNNVDTADTTPFDYDLELTPRVWLEICKPNQLGFRATWWQFDHVSPQRSRVVDNTGFETITAPLNFDEIDIAAAIPGDNILIRASQPGDVFAARADLKLDTLDLEGTKWTDFCSWQFGMTGGLRYVSLRNSYQAAVFNAAGATLDVVDLNHRFDGIGPTLSVEARRPMGCITWFSMARCALLYGNGKQNFTSLEDITPGGVGRTTIASFQRNDVLTTLDLQFGIEWCRECCNGKRLFCRTALEGQAWQGAGDAVSEDGNMGLFGFHVALGTTL